MIAVECSLSLRSLGIGLIGLFTQKAINWAAHTSRVLFLIAEEAGKSKNKTDLVSDEKMFPGSLGERFLGCRHNSGVKYLM